MMIREAVYKDMEPLLALYHSVEKTPTEDSADASVVFKTLVNDPDYHILVAEEEGRVVSSCTCIVVHNMTWSQRPYAMVENVATLPQYQRRGFATACMNRAKEIAQENGCYKIYLTTSSKNESIWRFYESLGYSRGEKTAFIQRL